MSIKTEWSPDFFIAGFPKCGTTSLHDSLDGHPEISMSRVKEPHYFSPDIEWYRALRVSSAEEYYSIFSHDNGKLRAESSTWYLYSSVAINEINRINGFSKFVVCLRLPSKAIESLIVHRIYSGKEESVDPESVILDDNKFSFYSSVYDYRKQIDRLLSIVDRKRVHFVILEDLIAEPSRVLQELQSFLGVSQVLHLSLRGENQSKSGRPLLAQRIASLFPLRLKVLVRKVIGGENVRRVWRFIGKALGKDEYVKRIKQPESKVEDRLREADILAVNYLESIDVSVDSWKF